MYKLWRFFFLRYNTMLRIAELTQKDRARADENHKTYKMLYEKCANHVRRRHALGHRNTIWTVDSIVIGRPVFRYEHALRYIVEKLRKGGFDAYIDRDTYAIAISWEPKKTKHTKKSSKSSGSTPVAKDARKKKVSDDILNAWLHDTSVSDQKKKRKKDTVSSSDPLDLRLKRLQAKISIQ